MKKYRTWAEINLGTLKKNFQDLRRDLESGVRLKRDGNTAVSRSSGIKILVVVKADAYGHGAVPVSRTVLEAGADLLGVGDSTEAIELRQAGILAPILILGALIEEEISWIVSYDIMPTVHSMDLLPLLNAEAKRQNKRLKIHLKVDTGMTRLGASPERAIEIVHKIAHLPSLELEGISTHLSASFKPEDEAFTSRQIALFNKVVNEIEKAKILPYEIPLKHIASTAGIYTHRADPGCGGNLVRVGAILYGIDPWKLMERGLIKLHPILSLKSQITFIKTVPAGTPVGYGRTYTTTRRTRIATIPIGYNDGYPYYLANKGYVLIKGERCPVIGTVSMDYIMVDITPLEGIKVGDEVVLIGKQGDRQITAEDLARLSGLSPYVITCSLGKRVRRIYV